MSAENCYYCKAMAMSTGLKKDGFLVVCASCRKLGHSPHSFPPQKESCEKPAEQSGHGEVILAPNERVIGRLNSNGKWLEFWWQGETHRKWTHCCKACMFFDLLDQGLEYWRLNYGCVGMIVTWEDGEPTAVRLPGAKS